MKIHKETMMFYWKIYPRNEWLVVVDGLPCWHLICPLQLPTESDESFDADDDDENDFGILILNGGRLWLACVCWLIATNITFCSGVIFGTDWNEIDDVGLSEVDDDTCRCGVFGDIWRERLSGDVRLIELLWGRRDVNEMHKSVLGKRRVHLEEKLFI